LLLASLELLCIGPQMVSAAPLDGLGREKGRG
jgi:hypothetical protein